MQILEMYLKDRVRLTSKETQYSAGETLVFNNYNIWVSSLAPSARPHECNDEAYLAVAGLVVAVVGVSLLLRFLGATTQLPVFLSYLLGQTGLQHNIRSNQNQVRNRLGTTRFKCG